MKAETKKTWEYLYSDTHEICFISKQGSENNKKVIVTIESGHCFNSAKTITVKVDDVLNCFALYSGTVTTIDYETIKSDHGLLIDYDDFVVYFINLLKKCKNKQENGEAEFSLHLVPASADETGENILQILEVNQLRMFRHLEIPLNACDDEEVKLAVCKRFRELQETNVALGKQLEGKCDVIRKLEEELQTKVADLENTAKRHEGDINKMRLQCIEDICKEKERMDEIIKESEKKNKAEVHLREEQHAEEKQEMENRVKGLKKKLCEMTEKCRVLNLENEELSSVIRVLQEKERAVSREVTKLSLEAEAKTAALMQKEATSRVLSEKYKTLLKDFTSTAEKLQALEGQLRRSVEAEGALKKQVGDCQRHLQEKSDRADKASRRCRQLEAELEEQTRSAVKLRDALTDKERALKAAEGSVGFLTRQLRQMQLQQPQRRGVDRRPTSAPLQSPNRPPTFTQGEAVSSYFPGRLRTLP